MAYVLYLEVYVSHTNKGFKQTQLYINCTLNKQTNKQTQSDLDSHLWNVSWCKALFIHVIMLDV